MTSPGLRFCERSARFNRHGDMSEDQVEGLHSGDEVFWNDPGAESGEDCSRQITIGTIEINGDVVCITGKDGSYLECYAEELS